MILSRSLLSTFLSSFVLALKPSIFSNKEQLANIKKRLFDFFSGKILLQSLLLISALASELIFSYF